MRKVKFTREERDSYRFELFENGACTERRDGRSLGWCILCEDVELDEHGATVEWDHRGVDPELPTGLYLVAPAIRISAA